MPLPMPAVQQRGLMPKERKSCVVETVGILSHGSSYPIWLNAIMHFGLAEYS